MPCLKCKSDFNLFNWKIKCGECDDKYCSKCLKKNDGVFFCEKCTILLKRPPDRHQLMELRAKDLQEYLKKHNISTYGMVEKQELVDLFCNRHIPVKQRRGTEKLTANFAGSLPNIRASAATFNDFIESHFTVPEVPRRPPRRDSRPYAPPPGQNNETTPTSPARDRPQRPPPPRSTPTSPIRTSSPPTGENNTNSENGIHNEGFSNNLSAENVSEATQNTTPLPTPTPDGSPLPQRLPKLSDYETIEELNDLTTKQLKIILTLNRVGYKGCVEKGELLDRVKRLWNDSQKYKTEELPDNVEDLCKLCMDAPLDCVLLECGHIATCIDCGKKLAECPICRQYVSRVVRTFKA